MQHDLSAPLASTSQWGSSGIDTPLAMGLGNHPLGCRNSGEEARGTPSKASKVWMRAQVAIAESLFKQYML